MRALLFRKYEMIVFFPFVKMSIFFYRSILSLPNFLSFRAVISRSLKLKRHDMETRQRELDNGAAGSLSNVNVDSCNDVEIVTN